MNQLIEFFQKLFLAEGWPARWVCGKWTDFHGWLYIVSDLAIWAAYFTIPLLLLQFLLTKRDVPLPRVFWLFIAFILLCGLTHLVDAVMFWWPVYRISAMLRFITACVSWLTVFAIIRVFPEAKSLKTSREFNIELEERKKVEQVLNEKATELRRKNKELEQYAYVASHDLQEPLRTISNFVELLKNDYEGKLDENADQYISYITKASDHMQTLIKDLLEYSRIGFDTTKTKEDTKILVEEVLEDIAVSLKEHDVEIYLKKLPQIHAYRSELKSLFQNLISNSIKYRKQNVRPHIEINADEKENEWLFSIKDNGIGIEPKHHDRIFAIFQKLHSSKQYAGSGIGLAHCKKIVEMHGGAIWLNSELNKGSIFYFTIPKTNL